MVGDALHLGLGRARRPDREGGVHLHRIGGDHLAVQLPRQADGQRGLAGGGGARHGQDGDAGLRWGHETAHAFRGRAVRRGRIAFPVPGG